ncbi:MAG TPA: type II secretion system F family protein [Candidatus Paceibacterota bacterium]|nr:type II secretion system F family protein [Verrucomicrobiota bacterium]HRY51992.1 type II secretion system F family protein [Candidatus Paceibacterota bacterium]
MTNEEIGFFNQQLAGMLRTGIPLERGIDQLCRSMKDGVWREELEKLSKVLGGGTPLPEALKQSRLPPVYCQMLKLGAQGKDLPGMLVLVADYYHRRHQVWTRLKGLMVYPTIVLATMLVMSIVTTFAMYFLSKSLSGAMWEFGQFQPISWQICVMPVVLGLVFAMVGAAFWIRSWQHYVQWRLPAFREAALAGFASTMALMMKKGVPLPEALEMVEGLDKANPLNRELGQWREKMGQGAGKAGQFAQPGRCVPPLFVWLLHGAGEDLVRGFDRAAEVYEGRARHLSDVLLQAALPVLILLLGSLIVVQLLPALSMVGAFLNALGGVGM